ncbi:MAG TPA: D-arabinono-1,4-lactone oxidase [Solirubrobacteraceae bacterium]|nr:D-arabinono-1,4-lactone oxidase [Solirubrobacteraceae bacterium]
MPAPATNWSGNYRYRAGELHRPQTLDELCALAGTLNSVHVLGTRHTFTGIGDAAALVMLEQMEGAAEITVDRDAMAVSVGPAVTYAMLADALNAEGLALANLASLPHISVAGAVATATHGSGDRRGNLATSVLGVRLVTSAGEVLELDRSDPRFAGAVIHLGALGIVTRLTLEAQPYYELRQDVYEDLEWDVLFAHLDEITGAGVSVSIFHRFGDRIREVWVKSEAAAPGREDLFGARPAPAPRNPVPGADPANCTPQLGVPGPWSERLPHFRSGFTPSAGDEIQTEFFVARADAAAAVHALRPLAAEIQPRLLVAELRTIAADSLWLSPQHERDSVGLHFTWRRLPAEVETVVAAIERALEPFAPRPHWGKMFTGGAEAAARRYPRLEDFRRLRAELDPRRAFVNDWLTEHVTGSV